MRIVTLVLAAVVGCGVSAALAQQPLQPPAPDARWSFKRVDDGFVRLDNRTGQVAHCTPVHAGWTCQAVPERQAALEQQIAQLQAEVAALKKEIAQLRAAPPPAAAPPSEKGPSVSIRMPTQQDIDRARAYIIDSWQRLVQMIMHFQHEVLRKS